MSASVIGVRRRCHSKDTGGTALGRLEDPERLHSSSGPHHNPPSIQTRPHGAIGGAMYCAGADLGCMFGCKPICQSFVLPFPTSPRQGRGDRRRCMAGIYTAFKAILRLLDVPVYYQTYARIDRDMPLHGVSLKTFQRQQRDGITPKYSQNNKSPSKIAVMILRRDARPVSEDQRHNARPTRPATRIRYDRGNLTRRSRRTTQYEEVSLAPFRLRGAHRPIVDASRVRSDSKFGSARPVRCPSRRYIQPSSCLTRRASELTRCISKSPSAARSCARYKWNEFLDATGPPLCTRFLRLGIAPRILYDNCVTR
ncbi:hypothetical protein BC628DRAFT_272075 [Trametes gibbosa]|nr:hypothetical protein BC628DRAFT_272075 [Trametes gibbosa]